MLLEIRAAGRAALFQACQQRVPGDSKALRVHRECRAHRAADLLRAAAAVSTCRAWILVPNAPESKLGFLLNHLIPELLPERNAYRYGNCDPVTGQAAWYDLRVRIEKASLDQVGDVAPQFAPLSRPLSVAAPPGIL